MLCHLQAVRTGQGDKMNRGRLHLAGCHPVAGRRNPNLHKAPLAEARLRRYDPAGLFHGLTVNNLHRRLPQEGDEEITAVVGKSHPLRLDSYRHCFDLGKQGTRRVGLKM